MADRVRGAIADAAARFAFSATARLDAELLMAHALGIGRDAVLLGRLDDPVPPGFAALVERRAGHEPIAYITGTRAFWTIELEVGPGVLVPRADSETLIEAAIAHFGERTPATILDLGTGPGTLLLAALDHWPAARGLGVERSDAARAYALRNVARLGMADRARIVGGTWADGIDSQFDLLLCNPPYVATVDAIPDEVLSYEPGEALFAGADGLSDYRLLAPELPRLIAPGGAAVIEIGWTQGDAVAALIEKAGLRATLHRDLAGRPRCIVATA
jgi:release factor glutamine methyltransferase